MQLPSEVAELQQRIEQAVEEILATGTIDGAPHKMWTLDQVLRLLTGDQYPLVIEEFEEGGEYEWDEGIAP